MMLVVDANILLAAVIRDSLTRSLLLDGRLELYAPADLFDETVRHVTSDVEIIRKTKLSPAQLRSVLSAASSTIHFVPNEAYANNLQRALGLAAHPEDAPYLALAMSLNCPLWSNDADMRRQDKVSFLTTAQLVEQLNTA